MTRELAEHKGLKKLKILGGINQEKRETIFLGRIIGETKLLNLTVEKNLF